MSQIIPTPTEDKKIIPTTEIEARRRGLPDDWETLVKSVREKESFFDQYTKEDIGYIAKRIFDVELYGYNIGLFIGVLVISISSIPIALITGGIFVGFEYLFYSIALWFNEHLGLGPAIFDGSIKKIENVFDTSGKNYQQEILITIHRLYNKQSYNKQRQIQLPFDFDLYQDWTRTGIRIPIFEFDDEKFDNNPDYDFVKSKVFRMNENSNLFQAGQRYQISYKDLNDAYVKIQFSWYQIQSLFQHLFMVNSTFEILFSNITRWNKNNFEIINNTLQKNGAFGQTDYWDYIPLENNQYGFSSQENIQYMKLGDAENNPNEALDFIVGGPIFIGYLVKFENGEVKAYNKGPHENNNKITGIPVYLKINGWFTTSENDGYINCNPLKIPSNTPGKYSCWEVQMHSFEGEDQGYYFLDMNDAFSQDFTTEFSCQIPIIRGPNPEEINKISKNAEWAKQDGGNRKKFMIDYSNKY